MNVVGRVGSLISQGVYSVATPFHPFGGAVDIIVVEQEDGTYRSTPWYVRFGKFQGIIKGAEKIVTISVNGIEANFHMFLDNSGQAYFMREVVSGGNEAETSNAAVDEANVGRELGQGGDIGNGDNGQEAIYDEEKGEDGNEEEGYDFQDEEGSPQYSYGNLDVVEDLVKSSNDTNSEMVLVSVDGHVLTAPISMNEEKTDDVQMSNPQFHLGPGGESAKDFGASGDIWEDGLFGDFDSSLASNDGNTSSGPQLEGEKDGRRDLTNDEEGHIVGKLDVVSSSEDINVGLNKDDMYKSCLDLSSHDMFKSCLDLSSHVQDAGSVDIGSSSLELDPNYNHERSQEVSYSSELAVEETAARTDCSFRTEELQHVRVRVEVGYTDTRQEDEQARNSVILHNSDIPCCNSLPTMNNSPDASGKVSNIEGKAHEPSINSVSDVEEMCSIPERSANEGECSQTEDPGLQGSISGLGFEVSLCGKFLRPGMGQSSAEAAFEAHRISEENFKMSGPSIIKNGNLIIRFQGRYLSWDKAAYIVLGKATYGSNFSWEPKDAIPVEHELPAKTRENASGPSPSSSRRWRLWPIPFRRAASLQHSNSNSSSEELFVDSESGLQSPTAEHSPNVSNIKSPRKQYMRTYIPTTEQIASLKLKDGQNVIAFSFSTRVLGKQEVDAHIYLWKWNARIVISDVDGTITKSDVLGQVMPLVGKDWSQSGVAGLFSAIKENGYQLLFLSARAIVQAYLTRSFLLNLKQDGKALPSGPVVISPDGLFPSLYREVIRRAPHEFKIACLEDIRALFPSDYNPFYAGFGNRDTDELSYRKIGIPKGKIFIINPKGEVAINHCIDVKSYTSLHTLVNDMFPPASLVEQEDFNSWNFWKIPLPNI